MVLDKSLRNAQLVMNSMAVQAAPTAPAQLPTQLPIGKSYVDLQDELRKERRKMTHNRWSREQTVFKCVNELALLYQCQIFLIIQHNGEEKKQVYHSQPERKNWPLSYADICEYDYPVYLRCPETMPPVEKVSDRDTEQAGNIQPVTPSSPIIFQHTADPEEVPQNIYTPASVDEVPQKTATSAGTMQQRQASLHCHTVTHEISQRLQRVQGDQGYEVGGLPLARDLSLGNHTSDKDLFDQLRPFPHHGPVVLSPEQAHTPATPIMTVEGPTYDERRLAPAPELLSAGKKTGILHGRVHKDEMQGQGSPKARARRNRGSRCRAGMVRRL